jgi:hypothetical protein
MSHGSAECLCEIQCRRLRGLPRSGRGGSPRQRSFMLDHPLEAGTNFHGR